MKITFEAFAVDIGVMYDTGVVEPDENIECIEVKENKIDIYLSGWNQEGQFRRTVTRRFNNEPNSETIVLNG